MRTRTKLLAAACTAAAVVALSPGGASATPGKSPQWVLTLVGTCDGHPATIIDPPGPGPTGFDLTTGKMGVGRIFTAFNTVTGAVAFRDEYGRAVDHAHQPIVTCDFPIPPDRSPDGTGDWVFEVVGFFR
jgi:hypothetical protein